MNEILMGVAVLSPIAMGLTEAAKRTGRVTERWAPLVAVGVSVAAAFIFPPVADVRQEVATGVLAGLSAAGLYSGGKALSGR